MSMSQFFDDTMQSLLEAIEIEKGNISLTEKDNMPAPTFVATEKEKELIDELINIRKSQNISQNKLAELTGNKQQAISRMEKKEHSPSLKLFYSMVNALGYDLQIVKQNA
jgi:DNA-binding XRE family transcriptional regulator